jgi:BRCT domain type II-containing protein
MAASNPDPTRRSRATVPIASVNVFPLSPTVIASEAARQRCPAQPKALSATIVVAASKSASGSTTIGFLAPPCAWTRLPVAALAA